jgi:hypothetical protein
MGGSSSKHEDDSGSSSVPAGRELDLGSTPDGAAKILQRRLEKAKAALAAGKGSRATEKAASALKLCQVWSKKTPPLPDAVLLDALYKSIWILGRLVTTAHPKDHPVAPLVTRAMVAFADICARHCGKDSWQLADIWYCLSEWAERCEQWPVAINFGTKASELLLKLRGEQHFVPHDKVVKPPWDAFGNVEFWTSGHIDALEVLVRAHVRLAEAREAQAAAARHLQLLEAIYGRGAVETLPGLLSMMEASAMEGAGDLAAAVDWARRIVALRIAANGGSPYAADVAAAYENVAAMFLLPGPRHSPDTAQRVAEYAAQLRHGCLADMEPNEHIMLNIAAARVRAGGAAGAAAGSGAGASVHLLAAAAVAAASGRQTSLSIAQAADEALESLGASDSVERRSAWGEESVLELGGEGGGGGSPRPGGASSPERAPSQTFVALSSSYAAAEVGAAATAAAATISEAQAGDAKAKDAAAAEQATAFLAEIGKEVKEM